MRHMKQLHRLLLPLLGLLVVTPLPVLAQSNSSDELYPHRRGRRVVFRIEAAENASVYLIGDFNDWDRYATPMNYEGDNLWETRTRLQAENALHEYPRPTFLLGVMLPDRLASGTPSPCLRSVSGLVQLPRLSALPA